MGEGERYRAVDEILDSGVGATTTSGGDTRFPPYVFAVLALALIYNGKRPRRITLKRNSNLQVLARPAGETHNDNDI